LPMIEGLRHELQSLLADGEDGRDRVEARSLLRACLARNISEGLAQAAREHERREAVPVALAHIAAYLDCSLSQDEWQAVVAKLADDPAVRADVASAVRLLDDLEAPPLVPREHLLARAVDALSAPQVSRRAEDRDNDAGEFAVGAQPGGAGASRATTRASAPWRS